MDSTDVLIEAAWAARRNGRQREAESGLRDAIDASRRSGNRPQLVSALGKLAHVLRDLGRKDEALPPSEEAVRISRGAGDPQLLAHAVRHLGDLHRGAGRFAEADRCYDEALALYRAAKSPDALDFANALRPAALLKAAQGARAEARALFDEARAVPAGRHRRRRRRVREAAGAPRMTIAGATAFLDIYWGGWTVAWE